MTPGVGSAVQPHMPQGSAKQFRAPSNCSGSSEGDSGIGPKTGSAEPHLSLIQTFATSSCMPNFNAICTGR